MAKHEDDREDLLLEGVAMTVRGQIRCAAVGNAFENPADSRTPEIIDHEIVDHEIVIGWRPGGAASWFWNQDPVFQFNAEGRLRRAFYNGQRLSGESGQLCDLTRDSNSGDRVELLRKTLDADQSAAVLRAWQTLRTIVEQAIDDADAHVAVVGCTAEQFRDRVRTWLQLIDHDPPIADNPDL